MATGILALLDDVALLTKMAAKKASGVIGDDLALNAKQVSGVTPEQELPIIYAVAKGAFKNKLVLVPMAILITSFASWLVTPLLMLGGAYLCFEGVEKILEKLFPHPHEEPKVETEEDKIKGAIRTDFILSAEIIIISLGAISQGSLLSQILALSVISIVMTIGIYGLVAFIIKLDDMGLKLAKSANKAIKTFGLGLVNGTPYLMNLLGIVGTAAMFLVGGGIIAHGVPLLGHGIENLVKPLPMSNALTVLMEGSVGIISGLVIVGVFTVAKKFFKKGKSHA